MFHLLMAQQVKFKNVKYVFKMESKYQLPYNDLLLMMMIVIIIVIVLMIIIIIINNCGRMLP